MTVARLIVAGLWLIHPGLVCLLSPFLGCLGEFSKKQKQYLGLKYPIDLISDMTILKCECYVSGRLASLLVIDSGVRRRMACDTRLATTGKDEHGEG
jgi:hypothetical protein